MFTKKKLTLMAGAITALAITAVAVVAVMANASGKVQAASNTIVKVTQNDVAASGAWSYADTRNAGTGTFEAGPLTPPYGRGSFALSTTTGVDKVQLMTDRFDHTPLASIDGIGYQTYRDPASTGFIAGVAGLNMRVDLNGDGVTDAYMVYEPYQDQGNSAVQTGSWQSWDAYNGGQAKWWISRTVPACGQSHPCTWATILSMFPNATIREGTDFRGSFGVNQGSGNGGIISNVDGLRLSVSGTETIFNFEPLTGPPTSMDQCKDDGWKIFDNPTFKNQGDCVSFVNTGK